ncbi:MAG: MBL fold metallo-hydrolase [Thermomicrobiales bacterium]
MKLTFLGTGTSNGIPVIGCTCRVCTSDDPRDKRTRTSAFVEIDGKRILIDTSPELRLQSLAVGLDRIDAVLFTHPHADHVGGFDDLRRFNQINQAKLPVYTDELTAGNILQRFGYAFEQPFPFFGGKPDLDLHIVEGEFDVLGIPVESFQVGHGRWIVNGFRFGDLVYLTDAKDIPEEAMAAMRGARHLVINALRRQPHPVHLSLDEALEVIDVIGPEQAYIVHISHDMGTHAEVSDELPAGVQLAYDGLSVFTP